MRALKDQSFSRKAPIFEGDIEIAQDDLFRYQMNSRLRGLMSQRKPIALFYGSSTCYTEIASEKIRDVIGNDLIEMFNVTDTPIIEAQFYPFLIMGIPTWDYGELQEDWEDIWQELEELDLKGKKVALFGLGDQIGYPEWFLDAMGYLHDKLASRGANFVGYWKNEGYEFESSKALTPDQEYFVGLALDEENEFDKTQERIELWCAEVIRGFGIDHVSSTSPDKN